MERDGSNISSSPPQSETLISVPYSASKIIAMAQEKVRNNISPLAVLRKYICPRPHRSIDSITAMARLRVFVGLLSVIGMSDAPNTSLHPSGDEEYSKDYDEASCKGNGSDGFL